MFWLTGSVYLYRPQDQLKDYRYFHSLYKHQGTQSTSLPQGAIHNSNTMPSDHYSDPRRYGYTPPPSPGPPPYWLPPWANSWSLFDPSAGFKSRDFTGSPYSCGCPVPSEASPIPKLVYDYMMGDFPRGDEPLEKRRKYQNLIWKTYKSEVEDREIMHWEWQPPCANCQFSTSFGALTVIVALYFLPDRARGASLTREVCERLKKTSFGWANDFADLKCIVDSFKDQAEEKWNPNYSIAEYSGM
ncbi:hypothetical protein F4780DRAFT_795642 [Xylariomycetidae sp. FL0641]|nr:hypothetical protein F4780DRAFT_795642 [Xylariomycetidae sp. FL0641]